MKRKQFLACVLAMGVTLSPAGINAMVANAQEVTTQTNQASQTTNILVNNIVLDGVDAPSDGKLLDFSAATMLNGSSKWNMDIVWVDEAGRKATNWSASNKSYPVFYINPAGFTLKSDFNVESDIQLSDVVKSIYGDKKLEKIVDEKTGRIFMTCADGPCKGKDKKILAAICSAEIQNRCELEKERRNPTIYIKLDDKDDKKETDVKDEVVSTDNKPTDTTTTSTTATGTSTAPTDTTQNGTDTSDENNQQKDDEQQGGNNQQDDNSQQGNDNQQGDNNQTLSVEDMIKADQGKLTPEALAVELANQPGESDVISAINDKIKEITGLNYEWTVSEINFDPVYSDKASDEDIRVVLKSGNVEYEIEFVHVDIAAATSSGSNSDNEHHNDEHNQGGDNEHHNDEHNQGGDNEHHNDEHNQGDDNEHHNDEHSQNGDNEHHNDEHSQNGDNEHHNDEQVNDNYTLIKLNYPEGNMGTIDDDSIRLDVTTTAESDDVNDSIKWTSSNEDIAIVDDGVVLGLKPGKVKITATSTANPSISDSIDLEVSGIVLEEYNYNISTGGQLPIEVKLYGAAAEKKLEWSILEDVGDSGHTIRDEDIDINNRVVIIQNYATATSIVLAGMNPGTAYIEASAGKYAAVVTVKVSQ